MVVERPEEKLAYNCRHGQAPQQRGLTPELHIVTDTETDGRTWCNDRRSGRMFTVHYTCIIYSGVF